MSLKYDMILFDLDGTLIKSHEGVKESLIYALNKLDKPIPPQLEDTSKYIGPPLMDTLRNICKLSDEEAVRAAKIYSYAYNETYMFKSKCYDGIAEVLDTLKKNGAKLAVATTKNENSAELLLKTIGIYGYFDSVCGTSSDGLVKDKAQVISIAVERAGLKKGDKIVLIGDSKFDTDGANITGIDFIGVLYGYGLKADMIAQGAEIFVQTPNDLISLLL